MKRLVWMNFIFTICFLLAVFSFYYAFGDVDVSAVSDDQLVIFGLQLLPMLKTVSWHGFLIFLVQFVIMLLRSAYGDEWLGIWKITAVLGLSAFAYFMTAVFAGTPWLQAIGDGTFVGMVQAVAFTFLKHAKEAVNQKPPTITMS